MSIFPKVLIIDDEEDFCNLVKRNLESTGEFHVFFAFNAEDGIRLAKMEKPDVILLDIMMPGTSGAELATIFKNNEKTKDIPIIFVTAVVTKEDIGSDMKKIAENQYIAKPVKTEELINAIKKVMKK